MKNGLFVGSCFMLTGLAFMGAAAPALAQVVLTVGPHGTHSSIQDAIDLVGSGAATEIRVEGGHTYVENLSLDSSFDSGTLSVLGGWNEAFTSRPFRPQDTIIDGNHTDRVIDAFGIGGSLIIDGFLLTNGFSAAGGGGVRIDPSGDVQVTLSNTRIVGNSVSDAGGNSGGGVLVELFSTQSLEILNCRIRGNSVISTGGGVIGGGGLSIRAIGDSSFLVQDCEVDENTLQSAGQMFAAGVTVFLSDNAQGEILGNSVVENTCDGADLWVSGVYLELRNLSTLNMERTVIGMTTTPGASAAELRTSIRDESSMRMSDSIIGLGDGDGVRCAASQTSTVNLVNLTVVDTPGTGIAVAQYDSSTMTLYNTISYGNLVDLSTSGSVDTGFNLIGVDPHFLNPDFFDFHLGLGSPAENAGTNTPPGGLGILDLGGNPRIKDAVVDIGCYEGIAAIFADGFESGNTLFWTTVVP